MVDLTRQQRADYYRIFAAQMRRAFRGDPIENERAARGFERAAMREELGLDESS